MADFGELICAQQAQEQQIPDGQKEEDNDIQERRVYDQLWKIRSRGVSGSFSAFHSFYPSSSIRWNCLVIGNGVGPG